MEKPLEDVMRAKERKLKARRMFEDPLHPGDFIWVEILKPRGFSIAEAARKLKLPREQVARLFKGKVDLSVDLARGLEDISGIRAEHLLEMQFLHSANKNKKLIDAWEKTADRTGWKG